MIKYKAKNSLKSPRFSGIKTFMRMENIATTDDVDFAVVGIPYDTCASYRVGTRLGPAAIRDMSCLAAKPYNGPLQVGIFDECSGVDYGDIGSVPGYIEESFDIITEGMLPFFEKGVVPIAMGGDHSVTLPELRACAKANGPVALIHFDAHYDTIHEYFGKPYNHGTPVPGGFSTAQALEPIRGLKDLNIIGYDIVEVSPPYDPTNITAIAAAGLMQEFISHVAYRKKNNITF